MKKIDIKKLNVLSDKEFWRRLGNKIKLLLRELPRLLFIKHSHIINMIAVVLVLVLGAYLVLALFYFTPSDIDVGNKGQQKLTVDLLDRLGLWIEGRGQERQRLLELSDDVLYERPKKVIE